MSASARLRELDAGLTAGPWRANEKWESSITVGGRHTFTTRMRTAQEAESIAALANALPEIVAVVEAAEEPAREVTGDGIRGWEPLYPDLTAAIAALEEKLKP